MTNLEQAARQALEALEVIPFMSNKDDYDYLNKTITALRQALEQPTDSAAYHGWVLRDVLFDNGEPVGHREPRQASHKCIVKGCENHANQGVFVGDLCSPCHTFITTGEGVYSQAYRNAKRDWVGLTDEDRQAALESMPDMFEGFLRKWGCLHFSEIIEVKLKEKNT
jgi:hypothetical protein